MERQTPKRYLIVEPTDDGGVIVHEMKKWCRLNPSEIPRGMSAATTGGDNSQTLMRGFMREGWNVISTPEEVRISRHGGIEQAEDVLGDTDYGQQDDLGDETETLAETVFHLERQLQEFIASNLASIRVNGKRLRLYTDENNRRGIEYPTTSGRRIDILAVDEDDNFVVFELKRGEAPDKAIGQLTNYMGWVSLHIGHEKSVSGVIVARSISNSLREAIVVVPNVSLFEYRVKFDLNPIGVAEL